MTTGAENRGGRSSKLWQNATVLKNRNVERIIDILHEHKFLIFPLLICWIYVIKIKMKRGFVCGMKLCTKILAPQNAPVRLTIRKKDLSVALESNSYGTAIASFCVIAYRKDSQVTSFCQTDLLVYWSSTWFKKYMYRTDSGKERWQGAVKKEKACFC